MAGFTVDVEPDVLEWARKSIGLSLDEAAKKLDMTPLELRYLEEGADSPTLGQLRRMVRAYKRPLAVFFLSKPPKDFDAMKDFRLLPGTEGKPYSMKLTMEFRRIHRQREIALELSELEEETPPLLAVSLSLTTNAEIAGEEIRTWLGARERTDDLTQWIELVETKTILVTQVTGIDLTEMRGCSISNQPFPVIVLNVKDSSRGRIFSLMHELVHVLLHSGGLCDLVEPGLKVHTDRERIERFCNHVAAATLMPRAQVLRDPRVAGASPATRWTDAVLGQLADVYGVSREAMLLRLIELGRAPWDFYAERRPHYLEAYEAAREEQTKKSGGPSHYRMKLRNLGRRYITTVLDAYYRQDITGSELSDYLEIKVNQLRSLETELAKNR